MILIIRAEQMAAIGRARWLEFVERACDYAHAHWPIETEVRAKVEHALTRARAYGMESAFDLLRYVGVAFALGAHFDDGDEYPWAAEVLGAPQYAPHAKMDMVWQLTESHFGRSPSGDATAYDDESDDAVDTAEWRPEDAQPLDEAPGAVEPESEDPGELPPEVLVDVSTNDEEHD